MEQCFHSLAVGIELGLVSSFFKSFYLQTDQAHVKSDFEKFGRLWTFQQFLVHFFVEYIVEVSKIIILAFIQQRTGNIHDNNL